MAQNLSYKNHNDPTCKTYIYCYERGNTGVWDGYIESCDPPKPYFYGKECQAEKPEDCVDP
ncbi:uncharacterized protein LOC6558353 [Drosophila grimshawi]|uniref:uncharacterized protein LOC6558353 n=1 Tax=Drosophila grimshawi TaxID=7222 RepID=UPI001C936709|nr:uncharacterized protein LOC6558353 [Drosophila grimshawi]